MANSFVRYTGDGNTSAFAIPFSYRVETDLVVTLAGVATTAFTINAAGTTLTFTSTPSNGTAIEIRRKTSQGTKLVDYASGSVLTEDDLDTDSDQAFFMSQEAIDDANDVIKVSNVNFQYDVTNKRLINVANPVDSNDAVNKTYLENTWLSTTDKANLTTVAGISSDVTTVAGISSDVTAVANDATDIGTVASNIADVSTVATNISDVVTVANDLNEAISEIETAANDLNEATSEIDTVSNNIANVNTVGNNITNVNNVATDIANVNSVAGNSTNINAVAGNETNINAVNANSSNINAVNSNSANINTVAGDTTVINAVAGNETNINAVNANSSNINTVAGINADVTTVANDGTDIGTVATNIANVNTVAGNNANITTVAGNDANITTVAGISSDVTSVANDATDIGTVASDISNVNTVAGSITNVNTVATNVSDVNNFADRYRVGSTNPTTNNDEGDLFYNTTDDTFYVWTGSTWEAITDRAEALQAIATTKSDTAVDVFIYDTRKDSDGGAWRKRTQNTSWYNETLNTSTRGSRKEFPAVAVIVAENSKVTIYDGDDPSLPMWMVFNCIGTITTGYLLPDTDMKSVTALNGIICTGSNDDASRDGVKVIYMIGDYALNYGYSIYDKFNGVIADRNTSKGYSDIGLGNLVDTNINDVAITVLPNAPIDNDTGLPVPTIAVATDGGVSVIKDDGTVVDITFSSYGASKLIDFIDGDKIIFANDSGSRNRHIKVYSIPTSDISEGTGYLPNNALEAYQIETIAGSATYDLTLFSGVGSTNFLRKLVKRNFGQERGLTKVSPNIETPSNGMMANITSDHNTGWMQGDIKLATLSDTDDTDITGSELADVTNASDYDDDNGKTTIDATSNPATITYNTGSPAWWGFTVRNLTVGKTYVLTWETTNQVDFVRANSKSGTTVDSGTSGSITFVATGSTKTHYFSIDSGQSPNTFTATCRLAVLDRSHNNNGLQIFGTIPKTPVATGADLVSYGTWSSVSYLEDTNSEALTFGTGDFTIAFWIKTTDAYATVCTTTNGQYGVHLALNSSTTSVTIRSGQTPSNTLLNDNKWHQFIVSRKDNVVQYYFDGVPDGSYTDTRNFTATGIKIGVRNDGQQNLTGQLALLRISHSSITDEKASKMYHDEKFLFQENAKATLYGTSNDVVALAYDDTTKLLHAGTSNGRSVFNGLRRVDNTTDAVGASISASNGLVVDE